ncbi:hypothetical protein BaRGS_00014289, partial [Batillaria attramentaria]
VIKGNTMGLTIPKVVPPTYVYFTIRRKSPKSLRAALPGCKHEARLARFFL